MPLLKARHFLLLVTCLAILSGCRTTEPAPETAPIVLTVDPTCIRQIGGISELRRETYFGLCDHGTGFDARCQAPERYRYLRDLGVTFGRKLSVVQAADRWGRMVREDPNRPGYADLDYLRSQSAPVQSSAAFKQDMNGRLEIAAHGQHNAFPDFMEKWTTDQASKAKKPESLPANLDAAAELSAAVLKHGYTDFDRPTFYEPVNEPHWSMWRDPRFQQWHLKTRDAVHASVPDVQVGGPCLSIGYFYKNQYHAFKGLREFIDGTDCAMDFYSFHTYDFLGEKDGDFDGGRVTSGTPLESVLDLISNYTMNTYDKEVSLVFSEHGAYGADDHVAALATKHFPGGGFDWEMKRRSIDDFNMVSGALANTLVFMDHPHVVKKAVPFILLFSMGWDPKYYATLYTPRNFTDKDDWVASQKILFYQLARDIRGQRIAVHSPDPDLQLQAFADGNRVFTIINNLAPQVKTFSLALPTALRLTLRRVGRNADFTPYYREDTLHSLDGLQLASREAAVLVAEFASVAPTRTVNEVACYGDRVITAVEGKASFTVAVRSPAQAAYGILRVGISRPSSSGQDVEIQLNGKSLAVQHEAAATRIDNGEDYATCKIIRLTPDQLQASNTVTVSFPDGKPGSVGAVLIRTAIEYPKK